MKSFVFILCITVCLALSFEHEELVELESDVSLDKVLFHWKEEGDAPGLSTIELIIAMKINHQEELKVNRIIFNNYGFIFIFIHFYRIF